MSIFDEKTDRRHTGSMKWDVTEKELPMWVADMDFQTAPQITEAIIKRAQHGVFYRKGMADFLHRCCTCNLQHCA